MHHIKQDQVSVTYYEHAYHRHHPNRRSKSFVIPPTVIGKGENSVVRVSTGSQHPERDDDDKDSETVEDKHESLDQWQSGGKQYVEEYTKGDDADCK